MDFFPDKSVMFFYLQILSSEFFFPRKDYRIVIEIN